MGKEEPSNYYDLIYEKSKDYQEHYTKSGYFPLWQFSLKNLRDDEILDLGCGPGQVAEMLKERGIKKYTGIDFSEFAINFAKEKCPNFKFKAQDLFDDFEIPENCTVLLFEVLEHIENDLMLLEKLKKCKIIASVPNFDCRGHVRHFKNVFEVFRRYNSYLDDLSVSNFNNFFVIKGEKK